MNTEHGYSSTLTSLMTTFNLTQLVDSLTHISSSGTKSRINLCFISNTDNLLSCVTKPPLSTSNHDSITVTLKCEHHVPEKQYPCKTAV